MVPGICVPEPIVNVFVTDSGLSDRPTLEYEAAAVEVVRA